jgi:hypothetical protein
MKHPFAYTHLARRDADHIVTPQRRAESSVDAPTV